ncbi:DUF2199 domain-containing protein [Streptomyces sp. SID3343]|uniref:DUF2199 domain-containing protein n=1 Tax=Streptomyces sp. SID3343 TaxID=2690260 RepID=UPI00136D4A5F|nr:DUF2199 domain-containing protein [Streptomyces sp. SID3343]MYW04368.1 DUF2199 domain-containing protein [Streptomyces sp. SID3343]
MTRDPGFACHSCGGFHAEIPMSYPAFAPVYWRAELDEDPDSVLSADQCVIEGREYFSSGRLEIPVVDAESVFSWDVWVSLSPQNFDRAAKLGESAGREREPPYFGWLSTDLALYSPSTIDLKTHLHTRPVGQRPLVELEPTAHPLAIEQREGITMDRVRRIAEAVLHAGW